MAASDPVGVGYTLLYEVLSADATFMAYLTGGLWRRLAPTGTTPNYGLLVNQSGTDINATTASRIMTTLIYQVKVVGPQSDEDNLRAAYARADALLQPNGLALRNANGTLSCFRQQSLDMPDEVNGVPWLHVGGLYRIEV